MPDTGNRNNGQKTARNADGTFGRGNPDRPKGSRHRTTLAVQELLDGEAEALTRKAIDWALEGDTTALRMSLERLAPPCKDRHVAISFPSAESAKNPAAAMVFVLQAVAAGEITPEEGLNIARLVDPEIHCLPRMNPDDTFGLGDIGFPKGAQAP